MVPGVWGTEANTFRSRPKLQSGSGRGAVQNVRSKEILQHPIPFAYYIQIALETMLLLPILITVKGNGNIIYSKIKKLPKTVGTSAMVVTSY